MLPKQMPYAKVLDTTYCGQHGFYCSYPREGTRIRNAALTQLSHFQALTCERHFDDYLSPTSLRPSQWSLTWPQLLTDTLTSRRPPILPLFPRTGLRSFVKHR